MLNFILLQRGMPEDLPGDGFITIMGIIILVGGFLLLVFINLIRMGVKSATKIFRDPTPEEIEAEKQSKINRQIWMKQDEARKEREKK